MENSKKKTGNIREKSRVFKLHINEDSYLDLLNIAYGVFSPLEGFVCSADYHHIVSEMRLSTGEPWTIPITLEVPRECVTKAIKSEKISLLLSSGKPVATLDVEDVFKINLEADARFIFGTNDTEHPGVRKELSRSPYRAGGRVNIICDNEKPAVGLDRFLTPADTRKIFSDRQWKTIAGFQTRNPIHRAHEYLQRIALEKYDGLFIHPLIGWKKVGDFSADAVIASYKVIINEFYPKSRVLFGFLRTAMRYAGPREAIFHAIIRKNYGCTHFIVGRDHAGVKNFYGRYDAHKLCSQFKGDLGIEVIAIAGPYYCKKCGLIVTERSCSHGKEYFTDISGTKIREMFRTGKPLPDEFMRKEVYSALLDLYKEGKLFIERG